MLGFIPTDLSQVCIIHDINMKKIYLFFFYVKHDRFYCQEEWIYSFVSRDWVMNS